MKAHHYLTVLNATIMSTSIISTIAEEAPLSCSILQNDPFLLPTEHPRDVFDVLLCGHGNDLQAKMYIEILHMDSSINFFMDGVVVFTLFLQNMPGAWSMKPDILEKAVGSYCCSLQVDCLDIPETTILFQSIHDLHRAVCFLGFFSNKNRDDILYSLTSLHFAWHSAEMDCNNISTFLQIDSQIHTCKLRLSATECMLQLHFEKENDRLFYLLTRRKQHNWHFQSVNTDGIFFLKNVLIIMKDQAEICQIYFVSEYDLFKFWRIFMHYNT